MITFYAASSDNVQRESEQSKTLQAGRESICCVV